MNNFPASTEEFYRLRDNRTDRCTNNNAYQNKECSVHLSPFAAETATGQMMLLVVSNLLSRWCRKVKIVMPSVRRHSMLCMGNGNLSDIIINQMREADPYGYFDITDNAETSNMAIYIGFPANNRPHSKTVFINASGWLASISMQQPITLPDSEDSNLLGAITAACLGVAQIFKIAVNILPTNYFQTGIFDLFRLNWSIDLHQESWPANLNVGNILMIGAGSVGSSAAYCMRLVGLTGSMIIIDKDLIKVENFNRSPIFGQNTFGLYKSEAIANFMAGSSFFVKAVPLWWDEFCQQQKRSSFVYDIWLPLANEHNVRHGIQSNVPPLMIYASTTSNWGVNHGRHIPGRDDCLIDRFPNESSSGKLACATGQVETDEIIVDAALPFASLFAGLLITADLVRAQMSEYPQIPNFALLDLYGPLDTIQVWNRKPRTGCICRDHGKAFHDLFNRNTKYYPLFQF